MHVSRYVWLYTYAKVSTPSCMLYVPAHTHTTGPHLVVYMYVRMYVCMYVCTCVYVCMYVCMYVRMSRCACAHACLACVFLCMCVRFYAHTGFYKALWVVIRFERV